MPRQIVAIGWMIFLSTATIADSKIVLATTDDIVTKISREVLLVAYDQLETSIETMLLPAERALVWSNEGRLDGEVSRIDKVSETYPNLVKIPVPINRFEAVAFTKRSDIVITGWESLRPYAILIRIGSKYAELGTEGMNVRKLPSHEQIFRALDSSKYFDVAINTRMTGIVQIETQGLTNIKVIEPPLASYNLYHYLHKKHTTLIPKITRVLQEMERAGHIEKIKAQYMERTIQEIRLSRANAELKQ